MTFLPQFPLFLTSLWLTRAPASSQQPPNPGSKLGVPLHSSVSLVFHTQADAKSYSFYFCKISPLTRSPLWFRPPSPQAWASTQAAGGLPAFRLSPLKDPDPLQNALYHLVPSDSSSLPPPYIPPHLAEILSDIGLAVPPTTHFISDSGHFPWLYPLPGKPYLLISTLTFFLDFLQVLAKNPPFSRTPFPTPLNSRAFLLLPPVYPAHSLLFVAISSTRQSQ